MTFYQQGDAIASGSLPFRYEGVAYIDRFADVLDEARYVPIPDDWFVALSDVVRSTAAIEQGRYRAVNFAGAAAITAVRNALPGVDVPFVFGGDGASLLVRPEDRGTVEAVLSQTVTWVGEALNLDLRAALIPISAVRAAGRDLRVARYRASVQVDYAMFSGGGLAWAEAAMKRGLYSVPPAPRGARPDLTGLSCRFAPVPASEGIVLSLIVVPCPNVDRTSLHTVLSDLIEAVEASPAMGRPLPEQGPRMRPPWAGLGTEARAAGPLAGSLALRSALLFTKRCWSFALFRSGLPVGPFSPRAYGRELAANADFRKYDDGLRLTVACPSATVDAIETQLAAAMRAGLVRYGLHKQDSAIVTCISPSPLSADHLHFVDGASGGYACAALQLKRVEDEQSEHPSPRRP